MIPEQTAHEDKLRKCGHCQEWKPFEDFHLCKRGIQGRHSVCKPCRVKYNSPKFKAWKAANKERYNALQAIYRAKKKTKVLPDV